jgi:hypothetical protein
LSATIAPTAARCAGSLSFQCTCTEGSIISVIWLWQLKVLLDDNTLRLGYDTLIAGCNNLYGRRGFIQLGGTGAFLGMTVVIYVIIALELIQIGGATV